MGNYTPAFPDRYLSYAGFGAGRIRVPGRVARNEAPAERCEDLIASGCGVERARTRPGTLMRTDMRPYYRDEPNSNPGCHSPR